MTSVTRSFGFDSAHRVLRHESKCKHLHGHRYTAEVTVEAPELDELGRVVDFGVLKEIIGGWIDTYWDHNTILNREDQLLSAIRKLNECDPINHEVVCWGDVVFAGKEPYVMEGNPTAERMAAELFKVCERLLPAPLSVIRVRMYETPNCYADFTRH